MEMIKSMLSTSQCHESLHEQIWKYYNLRCHTFTVSWTITRANMEVVIMQTEEFISYPMFTCSFFANDQ